ncbi:hypothetical protein JF75_05530 [Lactobacillus kimbladii]|uniref:Uncharacterized protein n=1 Tax=Lactobacillus kimbladii TaxID=1218506 RepID=A0A0F4LLA9_9LACO|nr:hypothetical protein [Lactobacillus kimbladii]KJY59093.1 hypothetical protein JF75_05530 [Lactobacillus kimbladii]
MVDILVRNVPEKIVARLDQQVDQLNSNRKIKLSRNDYIKLIITNRVDSALEDYERSKYKILLQHEIELHELEIELFKQIIISLATGNPTDAINLVEHLSGVSDNKKKDLYGH